MVWIVAFLYVLAAALPAWGLIRLFLAARREAATLSDLTENSYGFVQSGVLILTRQIVARPRGIASDFFFIGGGVILGAVASVWSLFLP